MGTPGLSHSLLALWGPLSVELGTKRPRAGLFCHVQTGGYGEAGYKGREVLVIKFKNTLWPHRSSLLTATFHTQIFSHSNSKFFGLVSMPPTGLPWIWKDPDVPEASGEQLQAQLRALHSQTQAFRGAGHLPLSSSGRQRALGVDRPSKGNQLWGLGIPRRGLGTVGVIQNFGGWDGVSRKGLGKKEGT